MLLNLSRGPAVWSTRAQADRIRYNEYVVRFLAQQKKVAVIQAVAGAVICEDGRAAGVCTEGGEKITARAVIAATGTFLGGLIHIGEKKIRAGRKGEKAAYRLSENLRELGFEVGRLKTGTPPRLDGNTIDWTRCRIQPGDEPIPFFSYRTQGRYFDQAACYLTHTTDRTKKIISANFRRSPIFSGQIRSTGPRYCPSIEDKFFRFADKPSHQIFIEPEGNGTDEVYPNGFATGLPEEVQREAIRTVVGLEEARVTQPGYAIEYDYCPAHQIDRSLQARHLPGLFLAGQINGTSGYEEAAAQGVMAGVNAAMYIEKEQPFVLDRSEAYIGVMMDDLTTRSTTEPYRMFTSRAEYRLALREDNVRDRLFEHARRLGLIDERHYREFHRLQEQTRTEVELLENTRIRTSELGGLGLDFSSRRTITLASVLRRPGVGLQDVMPLLARYDGRFSESTEVLERAAVSIRYKGYIEKQQREIEKFRRLENEVVPEDFPYESVHGLKTEAREKFQRFRPDSLGQAGRIEGITPGDMAVLSVCLKRHKGLNKSEA